MSKLALRLAFCFVLLSTLSRTKPEMRPLHDNGVNSISKNLWVLSPNFCLELLWLELCVFFVGEGHKTCLEDGTWFRHPDTNVTWSNYTTCVDLNDLAVSYAHASVERENCMKILAGVASRSRLQQRRESRFYGLYYISCDFFMQYYCRNCRIWHTVKNYETGSEKCEHEPPPRLCELIFTISDSINSVFHLIPYRNNSEPVRPDELWRNWTLLARNSLVNCNIVIVPSRNFHSPCLFKHFVVIFAVLPWIQP